MPPASLYEEAFIVESRIWYDKIVTVNVMIYTKINLLFKRIFFFITK